MPGSVSAVVATTLGPVALRAEDGALVALDLPGTHTGRPAGPPADPLLARVAAELDEYLAGDRRRFTVPVAPAGTAFQRRVWAELTTLPYGTTVSYAELAARVGVPGGARAVGQANGRNPVPVVVPCHRVVAADGTLGGYSGGTAVKEALLALEGVTVAPGRPDRRPDPSP
jgi:methylated-DNA-[protein]-cysteine S-methyltransferase